MRAAAQNWKNVEPADGEALVSSPFGLCDYLRALELRGAELKATPFQGVLSFRPAWKGHSEP